MDRSAAFAVGQLAGALLVYGCILALGFYVSRRLSARHEGYRVVRWPIAVAFVLVLLLLLGRCARPDEDQGLSQLQRSQIQSQPAPEPEPQAAAVPGDVLVRQVISGPASEFLRDFNPEAFRVVSAGTRESLLNKFRENAIEVSADKILITTDEVSVGGRTILRSRVHIPSIMFQYIVQGVVGDDVVAVICASRSKQPFKFAGSDCERTAMKTYGG